jgi:hypothetical protein
MAMRIQILSANPDRPPSGNYADQEVGVVLELAVQRVLTAEAAMRQARQQFDAVLESCRRNRQDAQAAAALQSLQDRRSH